ncbi:MAG: hypothetical protein PHC56_13050 [Herbinix sp.]|nr:hypothetical protein [Herbinix sp.]
MDLENIIESLKKERQVFHSEADFQFALAWQIQIAYPEAKVRLEYCPAQYPNTHIDIVVKLNSSTIWIELKYKTLKLKFSHKGEVYSLKGHGAEDIGKYLFLKDLQRVEMLCKSFPTASYGYVIFLTNDPTYWQKKRIRKETAADEFRLHDGKCIYGHLDWGLNTGEGTKRGHEEPIELNGQYVTKWKDYSVVSDGRNGTFRYLEFKVE